MAITRFNKMLPRDYSMEWVIPKEVMPNIEAWSSLLGKQQEQFDATKMLLSEKMPKYLQTDEDRAILQQYKDLTGQTLDNITTQYQERGLTAGNQAMKEAARMLNREMQPGGRYNLLEDRYNAYQTALGEIEKSYKDDPRGINKQFATSRLQEQLARPIGYNPETGEYSRISTPELYKDPNIQSMILKAIDQVKESGNTDIIRLSPTMLQKIKTEGRSADVLGNLAEAIYEQYPKQLAIEAWYRKQNIDPTKVQEQYNTSLDNIVAKQEQYLTNAKSLKKEEIKKLQSELVQQGYDIKIDGSFGPKTEDALKQYNQKVKDQIEQKKADFNIDAYLTQQVGKGYSDFARGFANQKVDKSIIFDQAALAQMKIAAARKNTNSLISAMQEIARPETNLIGATPDRGINMDKWTKQRDTANTNLTNAQNVYRNLMAGKAGQVLGTDANNVTGLIEAYSKTGGNPNEFYNLIQADPKYTASRKIDLRAAFDYIQNNREIIMQATEAMTQAQQQKNMIDNFDQSITKAYSEKEGKKEYEELKKQFKKPWETDEQFRNALNNRDNRFNEEAATIKDSVTGRLITTFEKNRADEFIKKRNSAANKNPEYAKSVRTYSIQAPTEDKVVGGFAKMILNDIDNNDYYGYVDESQQGFSWKTKEGDKKDGIVSNRKVEITSFGESGKPQIKVTGIIKNKDGEEDYVETYLEIPETLRDNARQVILAAKAQAKRTNDNSLDEIGDMTLAALNGDINYTKTAAQDGTQLHLNNTQSIPVAMPVYNQKGEISNMRNTTMQGMLMDTEEVGGRTYKKYKVLGDEGQTYYRLTMDTPKGEVVVTNKNGGLDFNTSATVDNFLNGKKYDMGLTVNTNIQKVPTGQLITGDQINAMVLSQQATNQSNGELLDNELETEGQ